LQSGKEIEEARGVCEEKVWAVAVYRDGRWVVTAGGDYNCVELKPCEVETGIVKKFRGHTRIICTDISANNRLRVIRSDDDTAWIWNLDSGHWQTRGRSIQEHR
jgi:WD40 repeat protein